MQGRKRVGVLTDFDQLRTCAQLGCPGTVSEERGTEVSPDLSAALAWLDDYVDGSDKADEQARSIFHRALEGDKTLSHQEKSFALSWLHDSCDLDHAGDFAAALALPGLLSDTVQRG